MYLESDLVRDSVAVCGLLTCSISQSDLQRRQRDEPTELKGVRVPVGKRRARVGLVAAWKKPHRREEPKSNYAHSKAPFVAWKANEQRTRARDSHHLPLQLVFLPVDQYHCFLEHW